MTTPAGRQQDEQPIAELSLDRVHERVRQAILRGELRPGTIMSQVQLSLSLGVSRTTLREALRLLQREGLIEAEPNRRVRVAAFSVEDLEQLYALRIVNEALGIRLTVPSFEASDIVELRSLLQQMEACAEVRDADGWDQPHRTFHRLLVRDAGARTVRLLEELSDHSERYRRVYLAAGPRAWTNGPAEHTAIVDACERQDATAAGALLARHLSRTALTVLMEIAPDHDPRPIRTALRAETPAGGFPGGPAFLTA